MRFVAESLLLLLSLAFVAACSEAPQAIVEDPATGFALYRSGRLSRSELEELCKLGVEEMLVLEGNAAQQECVFRPAVCPTLVIRYDEAQDPDEPLTIEFLEAFDSWIKSSRAQGKKIAFRCRHGWHRTGRLAAYYRLRFEQAPLDEVLQQMRDIGSLMWLHPSLDEQVRAYADLVAGTPCSTNPASCPSSAPAPALAGGDFPDDACRSGAE